MKFRQQTKRRVSPNVDLTPLIDVVFQLLIFFMLSATFVVQTSIQIEMPQAEGAANLESKDLSITLAYGPGGPGDRGPVYVDDVSIASMEELTRVLEERIADEPETMLLIRTDSRNDAGRLVEVLGIATSVGISKIGIGAELPDEAP